MWAVSQFVIFVLVIFPAGEARNTGSCSSNGVYVNTPVVLSYVNVDTALALAFVVDKSVKSTVPDDPHSNVVPVEGNRNTCPAAPITPGIVYLPSTTTLLLSSTISFVIVNVFCCHVIVAPDPSPDPFVSSL